MSHNEAHVIARFDRQITEWENGHNDFEVIGRYELKKMQ